MRNLILPTVLAFIGILMMIPTEAATHTLVPNQISFQGQVHPRDFVEITQATPYTVPDGKILAITALGRSVGVPSVDSSTLTINGVQKGIVYMSLNLPHVPSVLPWTQGLAAQAGDLVETPGTGGAAYGYLVNE